MTIFKLMILCVLYNVAVFCVQPSPVPFGILTGLLVGAAFIVGEDDGVEAMLKIIILAYQREIQNADEDRNVRERIYATENKKHV